MKAMENELKDKPKVDRGLLNTWFVEVQRTKEEAENFHKRRATVLDPEKQLRFALQEIEQVKNIHLLECVQSIFHISYVLLYVKLKNMLNINPTNHRVN